MTKILKIGLVAGVNPIVAPFVKAAIFRAAAESARTVELVEDELELRKDAPTERIALGDSKITLLKAPGAFRKRAATWPSSPTFALKPTSTKSARSFRCRSSRSTPACPRP